MKNLYIDFEKEFTTVKLEDVETTEYNEVIIPITYEDLGCFHKDILNCIGDLTDDALNKDYNVYTNLPEMLAMFSQVLRKATVF